MDALRTRTHGWILAAGLIGAVVLLGGCFDFKLNVPKVPDPPDVYVNPPAEDPSAPPSDRRQSRSGGLGAYDTLAHPGKPVQLAAWLVGPGSKPVGGVTLGFQYESRLLAKGLTDSRGVAETTWTPPAAGLYAVQVRVLDAPPGSPAHHTTPVTLTVSCQDPRAPLVVVDLDDCIFDSSAKRAWLGSGKANPGSLAALAQIAQRHPLVYYTRNASELSSATQAWLDTKGYPAGVVLLSTSLPPTADARQFKSSRASDLMRSFPSVRAAIFEKSAPAEAFLARGSQAFMFADLDDDEDDPDELRDRAAEIRRLPRGMNVVTHWHQVQTAVLTGQQFPAASLAAMLDSKARRYERRNRDD